MSEKDELLLGTIVGVDIILSPEDYKEYKGTLNKQIEELKSQLQQKENIIKEVREYITYARTPRTIYESGYGKGTCVEICMEHLLEILDRRIKK